MEREEKKACSLYLWTPAHKKTVSMILYIYGPVMMRTGKICLKPVK